MYLPFNKIFVSLHVLSFHSFICSCLKIDTFVEHIEPSCVIKIIYFFYTIESENIANLKVPVALIAVAETDTNDELYKYYFYWMNIGHPTLMPKAKCIFNLLYFSPSQSISNNHTAFSHTLTLWMNFLVGGINSHSYLSQNLRTIYVLLLLPWQESYAPTFITKDNYLFNAFEFAVGKFAVSFIPTELKKFKLYFRHISAAMYISQMTVVHLESITLEAFLESFEQPRLIEVQHIVEAGSHEVISLSDAQKINSADTTVILNILRLLNATLYQQNEFENGLLKLHFKEIYFPKIEFHYEQDRPHRVKTFSTSLRVFTCYSEEFVSFRMYFSAFRLPVWILLIGNGIIIGAFLNTYVRLYKKDLTNSFSAVLFYISTLTEESYNFPPRLETDKTFRIAIIFWLLLSVIFTNSYVGNVISELNLPLRGHQLNNLSQLWCTISSWDYPENELRQILQKNILHWYMGWRVTYSSRVPKLVQSKRVNPYGKFLIGDHDGNGTTNDSLLQSHQKSHCFSVLSKPHSSEYPEKAWRFISDPFGYFAFTQFLSDANSFSDELVKNLNKTFYFHRIHLLSSSVRHYPKQPEAKKSWKSELYAEAAIEDEIVTCNKSVYMESNVESEMEYLAQSYPDKRFYYFGEPIEVEGLGWGFHGPGIHPLIRYFRQFIESGNYFRLHNYFNHQKNLERRLTTFDIRKSKYKAKYFDMTSSIQTIFMIYVCMVIVSLAVLSWEFVHSYPFHVFIAVLMGKLRIAEKYFLLSYRQVARVGN